MAIAYVHPHAKPCFSVNPLLFHSSTLPCKHPNAATTSGAQSVDKIYERSTRTSSSLAQDASVER